MTGLARHQSYLQNAKQELNTLRDRIEQQRARHLEETARTGPDPETGEEFDWERAYRDIQVRARETGEYLEQLGDKLRQIEPKDIGGRLEDMKKSGEARLAELLETGEQRWSEIQTRAESGFWDLRAVVQRIGEGIRPLLRGGCGSAKSRYYLQKAPDGHWALILDGAGAPTMRFSTKREGLKASRRYVRDRRPSELVVRRANGTFEKVHAYTP